MRKWYLFPGGGNANIHIKIKDHRLFWWTISIITKLTLPPSGSSERGSLPWAGLSPGPRTARGVWRGALWLPWSLWFVCPALPPSRMSSPGPSPPSSDSLRGQPVNRGQNDQSEIRELTNQITVTRGQPVNRGHNQTVDQSNYSKEGSTCQQRVNQYKYSNNGSTCYRLIHLISIFK